MTSSGRFCFGFLGFGVCLSVFLYGNVMDPLLINDIAAHRLDVGLLLAAAATAVGLLRLLRL